MSTLLEQAAAACSVAKTQLESASILLEEFEDEFPSFDAEAEVAFRRRVLGRVWNAISRSSEAFGKVHGACTAHERITDPIMKLHGLWQTTRALDHQIAVCRETGDAAELFAAANALQGWGEAVANGLDLLPLPAPLRRTLQVVIRLSTSVGAAGARSISAYFTRTDQVIAQLFRVGVEHNSQQGLQPPPPPDDLPLVVDTLLERLGSEFVRAADVESRASGLARVVRVLGEASRSLADRCRDAALIDDLDTALGGVIPGHLGVAGAHIQRQITGHTGSDFLLLNRALLIARRLRALAEEREKALELLTLLEVYVRRDTPYPAVVLLFGAAELRVARRTTTGARRIDIAINQQLGLAPVRDIPTLRELTNAG